MSEVTAIASRDIARARALAATLSIPKAYGTYEDLLADPDVDAIYNPLPNHLHATWTLKSAERGKHVLCEKPLIVDRDNAGRLIELRDRYRIKISEGYMFRFHPQWLRMQELVRSGCIGKLQHFSGHFSYSNHDPSDIRNQLQCGGGSVLDVGCYLIHAARLTFAKEPLQVISLLKRDDVTKTDILASILLNFSSGHATLTCGTQEAPSQGIQLTGSKGIIHLDYPFNIPANESARVKLDTSLSFFGREAEVLDLGSFDQHQLQATEFSRCILHDLSPLVSVEDSLLNSNVIAAVFRSATSARLEQVMP